MRFITRLLTITQCRRFADDECFKNIRNTLDKFGVGWEKQLEQRKSEAIKVSSRIPMKMDKAFFHPDRFEVFTPYSAVGADFTGNGQVLFVLAELHICPRKVLISGVQCIERILIDVRGFRPEEIKCTITNKTVEVSAEKEDQFQDAQKRMHLVRQYLLPKNAIPERGQCCLSSDGMLLVTAPWMP